MRNGGAAGRVSSCCAPKAEKVVNDSLTVMQAHTANIVELHAGGPGLLDKFASSMVWLQAVLVTYRRATGNSKKEKVIPEIHSQQCSTVSSS